MSAFDIQQKARLEEADGLDGALFTVSAAWPDPGWSPAGLWPRAAPARHRRAPTGERPATVAARALATLDGLSNGRAGVHLVIGSSDADVRRDGDFADKDERYRRAVEYLEVFTRALESREPSTTTASSTGWRTPAAASCRSSGRAAAIRWRLLGAGTTPGGALRRRLRRPLRQPHADRGAQAQAERGGGGAGRRLKFWKHFQVILGDSPARPWTSPSTTARPLSNCFWHGPRRTGGIAAGRRDGERDRLARLEPEALREWVANTVQRSFAGVLVGSVGEVAEQILAFHRAGIEIVQLEATTENAEDIRLRRQLIERLRRDA
ncbi:LLM class flavin-dependent oxidoreductase [Pseudomonas aeruginosa]|uniref:LLM class flavin-dependent oxidoreductase n=1 Tax=Pseudomonas aeruginosa TaxID=287 RepID=UPI000B15C0B5|nr:LLM class flavin-dependent oxidoreductase [Pseudomonas aeruginosa]